MADVFDLFSLNGWRTFALCFGALGQTIFVAFYLLGFPWHKSFLGRSLFGKAFSLMIIMDFAALSRLFGFGHSDFWFTILYTTLAIGVWWQLLSFFRVHMDGRRAGVSGNTNLGDEG